ncbi:M15 family metallopeptidase [Gordonia sp. (in: high G+C Gram-positive bacteria)]|uniref:M15 family metallopeptidase n=1 Tax=Gordonia sp. (in: high G+C Gram-positive bacteria) TaxID=84139 RepID=UPI0039E2C99E
MIKPMIRALVAAATLLAAAAGVADAAPVPPLNPTAAAEGLVDVRTAVPDAIVDMRYATSDNFTHVRLYPAGARCLVHKSMAPGLTRAAAQLRGKGLRLVFWDCYRPHAAQVKMWEKVPNPAWVAKPGNQATSHESARSVDVTLAHRDGRRLDMGTGFDDFSPSSHANAPGISMVAQQNRATLRGAMAAGGLSQYEGEWWHYDGPGAKTPRPHLKAPVN